MGILLGLSAAFWWGTSDFLAARVARHVGALRAILVTQTFGLIAVGAWLWGQGSTPGASRRVWVLMIGVAVLQTASVWLFYRAFEIGKLSLVAPITSGFAAVTAILALVSGERPARLALLGAALLVLGVLLVTRGHDANGEDVFDENVSDESERAGSTPGGNRKINLRGVPQAIVAAFGYGIVFWGLDFVVPEMGAAWPLAVMRAMSLLCLSVALVFLPSARTAPIQWKTILWPALGVALADTIAWLSFNAGTQRGDVAIVTTLASLYAGVAVFFAWLFFREKLQRLQWLGVAVILLGIVLVGMK